MAGSLARRSNREGGWAPSCRLNEEGGHEGRPTIVVVCSIH